MQVLTGVIIFTPLLRGFLFKVVRPGSDWWLYAIELLTFSRANTLDHGMKLAVLFTLTETKTKLKQHSGLRPPAITSPSSAGTSGKLLNEQRSPNFFPFFAAFWHTRTELS